MRATYASNLWQPIAITLASIVSSALKFASGALKNVMPTNTTIVSSALSLVVSVLKSAEKWLPKSRERVHLNKGELLLK